MSGHTYPKSEVLTGPERRRRWSAAEKLQMVAESRELGTTVSLVARRRGVSPSLLFTWRRLVDQGALTAAGAEEERGGVVHVNSLEGFFSVFKRGLIGVYQHVETQHLHRYTAEFDFRQNTRAKLGYDDVSRAEAALQGFKGKRLTYETTSRH